MAIADGIYHIDTAQEAGQCIDVCGETSANGANAMINTYHSEGTYSGNNQVFQVSTYSGDIRIIKACNCGKCLEVYGTKTPKGGENIDQFAYHGTASDKNQRWSIVDSGTDVTIDGMTYDAYYIKNEYNSNLVMDAQGASFKSGTNVFLCPNNGGTNQLWIFHKDLVWDKYLTVPIVGVCYSATSGTAYYSDNQLMWTHASDTLYPVLRGPAGGYQWRYRWRGRKMGTDSWTGWSAWTSPSGSTAESGWVDPWEATETTSGSAGIQRFSQGIAVGVDLVTYDRKGFQIEVRRFQADGCDYGATHGSPCTLSFYSVYNPTITMDTFAFSPDGLEISYASDFHRNGNAILFSIWVKVDGAWKLLVADHYESNIAYSGTITVPIGEIQFVPSDDAELSVWHTWSTLDATFDSRNILGKIAYNANHGTTVNATASYVAEGAYYIVTLASAHTSVTCWLETDNTFEACKQIDSTHFTVIPQLGDTSPTAFIAVDDGTSWATQAIALDPIMSMKYYVWNYDDTYTVLKCNKDASVDVSIDDTPDFESALTSGRKYQSVFFGEGYSSPITVSGAILVGDSGNADVSDFDRLLEAHYALFRAPTGERVHVAITDVKYSSINKLYRLVSISMIRWS